MKLSRQVKAGITIFCGFFVFAALTQVVICRYYRRAAVRSELGASAQQIAQVLASCPSGNLTRYRQAEFDAGHYYIIGNDGTLVDIEGFLDDLDLRVVLPGQGPGLLTMTVPETGETWRLVIKRLDGGVVILGVSPPEDITNVDDRLRTNADRFGGSIAEAMRVAVNEIDRNLDYALVDDTGRIRRALGGIPLKVAAGVAESMNPLQAVRGKYAFV